MELGGIGNRKQLKEHGIRNREQKTENRGLGTENMGQRTGKEQKTYCREERRNENLSHAHIFNITIVAPRIV
jgi:hypothetical protein